MSSLYKDIGKGGVFKLCLSLGIMVNEEVGWKLKLLLNLVSWALFALHIGPLLVFTALASLLVVGSELYVFRGFMSLSWLREYSSS